MTQTTDRNSLHAGYVSIAEISIQAPAVTVWQHVLDIGSWIYDFHFEHAAGDINREGEVKHLWPIEIETVNGTMAIGEKDRTADNALALKTLAAVPAKLWYGVNPTKLENGVASTGVNIILLAEQNGETLVTAIRSQESVCPTEQVRNETQANMIKYQPLAQFRWTNKYLPRLKQLSENSYRADHK